MKKKVKSRRMEHDAFDAENMKKPKLRPVPKEKYKPRNVLPDDDDEEEIPLFNFEND